MLNSKILFLLLLVGCATTGDKTPAVARNQENPLDHKLKCEEENNALACARYGYVSKDVAYTRRACVLGDRSSCFNLEQIESRAPQQNLAIISANQGQIFNCYANHTIDKEEIGNKEVYVVFVINPSGKIASLGVDGRQFSDKFKSCVVDSFASKKFMPLERDQHIRYGLVMPSMKKEDYRGKGGLFTDQ